mgnify:CR=1 FL=1
MLEEFGSGGAKSLDENHHIIACNNEWLIVMIWPQKRIEPVPL